MAKSTKEALWVYEDVARYLRMSPKTVERWANERRLPVMKVGALNRFDPDQIRAFARERQLPVREPEEERQEGGPQEGEEEEASVAQAG